MRSIIELIDALDVRKRILIIGSAFVDVIVHVPRLPLSGEDVEGSSRQQVVGGCAYNAADAVAKLGIDFDALIPVGEGMIAGNFSCTRFHGARVPRHWRQRLVPLICGARRRTHLRIDVGRGKML